MYESQGLLYSAPDEKTSSRSAVGPWNSTQIIDSERELSALLADIQDLEKRQGRSSRFRLLCRRLEPLVKFLAMYAPAVDMLVQFDVQPSALIWGSLRAILNVLQNSIRLYLFLAPAISRMADIFSISCRYGRMLSGEPHILDAIASVYQEVVVFLQRIEKLLTTRSIKIVMKSCFRSVDMEFEANLQEINRRYLFFQEEVTLIHRQHLENHMVQQNTANMAIYGATCNSEGQTVGVNIDFSSTTKNILAWLQVFDYQEPLRRTSRARARETGAWLVEGAEFRQWLNLQGEKHSSPVLWIHGAPGVGKSVLCGTIIEYLHRRQTGKESQLSTVAYFFGDSNMAARSTPFDICKTLLLQMQAQCQEPLPSLQRAYQDAVLHGRSHISDADDVFTLFRKVTAELESTYIIVDGLDECAEVPTVITWLLDVNSSTSSLRTIIFSRATLEIRKSLAEVPSLGLTPDTMKPDIEIYLSAAVLTLPCDTAQTKQHVLDVISRKADGMFLFAVLGIQALRQANNIDDTLEMVESTPNGVYNMYKMIFERLSTESDRRQHLAYRALGLISTSARPLTWPELRAALSWDAAHQEFRTGSAPFKDAVLAILCPLIDYREHTDTFRLVHLSLYEYMFDEEKKKHNSQDACHFSIDWNTIQGEYADMTLTQLASDDIARSISVNSGTYPLVAYTTKNWCYHLSLSLHNPERFRKYSEFIADADRRTTWILRWLLSEETSFPLQQIIRLHKLVGEWLEKGGTPAGSVDNLCDIQRALFRLDQLPQSMPGLRMISNFERLVCVRDLAREFTSAGKLNEGIQMFERALLRASADKRGLELGSCWLLNSLGILYDQQGKSVLAKETQQRALICQEQNLPPDHLDIVLTLNELGRLARHLGEYEEAESLHRKALAILESLLDESDLHITWTKSALGRSLLKQGRPSEAMPFHQQVLNVEVQRLGKDHPHTLWTMSDIVRCLRDLGRLDDAINMQQEIVFRGDKALGPKNPDRLWAMNSLGLLFELAGNRSIALETQQTAYAGQIEVLGENHPHCVWTRDVLEQLRNREI